MLTFIPHRYTSPKWQARITNPEQQFNFEGGIVASSLWDLKQALGQLPEESIYHHVGDGQNHIADWVEYVIGDVELARELRKNTHRWGMIVTLERHMMRTLNLPEYVAQRWLAPAYIPFVFNTGEKVNSLEELQQVLEKVSDDSVSFHLERVPNDISKWVIDVVGDYLLAELLEESSNRSQMRRFLTDHLEMLKEASS